MLYTTNVTPQHQTALHCEWRLISAKADAQLSAFWLETPQPDFRNRTPVSLRRNTDSNFKRQTTKRRK